MPARAPRVEPAFPAVLSDESPRIEPTPRSSGRRRALAAWLTRPDHPLTARVIVNRLWLGHFGRGLVPTPSDFGLVGEPPTHPELLDWLARELIDRGWSLKAMHRLIVSSATYRRSSRLVGEKESQSSIDALYARFPRHRLDGEAIRDSLLAVSGRLNPALGGPGVFPELPSELTRLSSKGAIWPVSNSEAERNRRSLYIFVRRNLRYPFFEAFDRPDTNASCPQRPITTIAPQALSLLNSRLSREAARRLAARVIDEAGPDAEARIRLAYRSTLGRAASDEEMRLAKEYVAGGESAWEGLCLALMNVNEFIYIE